MELSQEQQAFRNGGAGPELHLATETLIRYGEAFGAERLVPIVSAHLAGRFAISAYSGYYELLGRLVAAGVRVKVPTTINPHPGHDYSLLNRWLVFRRQEHHERQLERLDAHRPGRARFGATGPWSRSHCRRGRRSVAGIRRGVV